jgi:hypothetical protein
MGGLVRFCKPKTEWIQDVVQQNYSYSWDKPSCGEKPPQNPQSQKLGLTTGQGVSWSEAVEHGESVDQIIFLRNIHARRRQQSSSWTIQVQSQDACEYFDPLEYLGIYIFTIQRICVLHFFE